MHQEIEIKISAINKSYYAMKELFSSKLLSRQTKETGPAQNAMKENLLSSKRKSCEYTDWCM